MLAYVLDAQKTIEYRGKRAIKVLESLIDKNLAKSRRSSPAGSPLRSEWRLAQSPRNVS